MAHDAFPQAINPARMSKGLHWQPNIVMVESPLSGAMQQSFFWGRWLATFDFELMDIEDCDPILAFCEAHVGKAAVTIYDPARPLPRGTARAANAGVVDGAGQTGTTLATDGWGVDGVVLKAGDLIGTGTKQEMYRVASDTTSTAGVATITLAQPIRVSPDNNEALVVEQVPVRMWIIGVPAPPVRAPTLSSFRVDFREDLSVLA